MAGARTQLPPAFWVKQSLHIVFIITAFYFNSFMLVPRLLFKGKVWPFILSAVFTSLFFSMLLQQLDKMLSLSEQMARVFGRKMWFNNYIDHFALITLLLVLGISTSVSTIQRWSADAKLHRELQSQRTMAELSFLKAQINPHFFFNTLNSIYALTYLNVETSRQVLHKLSRMMRYLLYETEHNTTLLSKEVAFITDYVEIMKLRLNEQTTVAFTKPENLKEMPIAPMLLLPFVENAFKHGVDDLQSGTIAVNIEQTGNGLLFEIKNALLKPTINDNSHNLEGNGIGLANTRRRLDLLYSDKHTLTIERSEQQKEYSLTLTLTLI